MVNPSVELARIKQLQYDSLLLYNNRSFTILPLYLSDSVRSTSLRVNLLPFNYLQQFNSRRPLAYADGVFFPTRGWNFYYSAGVQLQYKGFLAILRPEFTWASNIDFPVFPNDHFPIVWKYYYDWQNKIDQPEQFSGAPLRKLLTGQSRIQFAHKGVAIGVSTENLWWGPGRHNALMLTNTAPGFPHITFHSNEPLITPIGTLEWQFLVGRVKPSGLLPLNPMSSYDRVFLHDPKVPDGNRSVQGGIVTWQPKWVKGLFLGVDGIAMKYTEYTKRSSKMGSVFMRYVMPKEETELYFQYGRHDKFASPINIFQDTVPRGYIGGIRKLIPLRKSSHKADYIQIGLEITQLQSPTRSQIQRSDSWYTDAEIRHGFTHEGQLLGAAIGPGSNAQRLDIAYINNDLKIGIELDRWLHNTDFYYNLNVNSGARDFNRHWVDLMASLVWNIPIKKVMFFGQFSAIRAINYQWKSYIPEATAVEYFDNGWDFINYHVRSGVQVKL